MSEPEDPISSSASGNGAPDGNSSVSPSARVARGLQTLFEEPLESTDPGSREDEPIPGASDSLHPSGPAAMPSAAILASELEQMGVEQSSALGKSRSLLIASQLYQHAEDEENAYSCALRSAETSPKLAVAALNLRKKSSYGDDPDLVSRTLQATSRHATQPSARTHALRLLSEYHMAQESREAAGEVLDHAARAGESDDCLLISRLVHRLATGSSLAGLDIFPKLEGAVATAQDILSDNRLPSASSAKVADELRPLQAARHLQRNEIEEAVGWLQRTEIPRDVIDELLEASLCAEPGGKPRAMQVLQELAQRAPSSRVLRQLARLAIELRQRKLLAAVLEEADPADGTFDLAERWFLAATAGQPMQIGRDEMLALMGENPALAIALGPAELPAPDLEVASSTALLAQLGAGLARLREPDAPQPLTEAALDALAMLSERGEKPHVQHALSLLVASESGDQRLLGRNLLALSDGPSLATGALIAAALLHKLEDHELAEQAYRTALTGPEHLHWSASLGLAELGVKDGPELLEAAAGTTEDRKLAFAQRLIATMKRDDDDHAVQALRAIRGLHSGDILDDETESKNTASLVFAAASYAAQRDQVVLAEEALDALSTEASPPGHMALVRKLWSGRERNDKTAHFSPLDSDPSQLTLDFFLGAPGQRVSNSAPDHSTDDEKATCPASLVLLRFAEKLVSTQLEEAPALGSLCAEVDHAAESILTDALKMARQTSELSPLWLDRAKATEDPNSKRFAYERLAELDELNEDHASALMWHKAVAEEFPDYVPSLLRLEESLLSQGNSTSTATEKLSEALGEDDSRAYKLVFGARALADSDLRSAQKHLLPLLDDEGPPLLAIRGLMTVARERRDDALLLQTSEHLCQTPGTDLDRCGRALGKALVLARLGRVEEAASDAKEALAYKGLAFAAHQLLSYLEEPDDMVKRGERLEAFGHASAVDEHRSVLFFEAGQAFDAAEDPERAAECYELTLRAAPAHSEAFTLLCERKEQQKDDATLEQLILARLELVAPESQEHLDLELKVAALQSAHGRPEEAKKHLETALSSHPEHVPALRAHAEVSAQLGAHEAAERSLLALHDSLTDGEERNQVLRSLARLYDEHLRQAEKAMDAYQAVLQKNPNDQQTRADLVRIYSQLGLAERATVMQTKIIQAAESPEMKRDGALKLAAIYENVAGDAKRAGATLERTWKAWPLDAGVLQATIEFMDRQGTGGRRGFLLDRAGKDARRKLETERLNAGLLDTLGRVAQLSGHAAQAESTDAARRAFIGSSSDADGSLLPGAATKALDEEIDEIIAPQGYPSPLRNLLRKTGAALDAAFAVDLSNLGAQRLESGPTYDRLVALSREQGLSSPELFVSSRLGAKCLPVTTEPARLLIGSELDEMPPAERDYLLFRALKLRWLGAGALARSKEEDRWPMLVALLHLFAPNWSPLRVDARKAAQAKALIEQGLARVGYDDDVPMLALEVIGALGNQGTAVGDKARVLANRAALLAVGDPSLTISAIARTEGVKLAGAGPSRFRFLEGHSEARDLLLFSTTEKCARARQALGLAPGSSPLAAPPGIGSAPRTGARPPAPPRRPKPPPPRR